MPTERRSLVQSIRLTGNGVTLSLRIRRDRLQSVEDFLLENDLADRIELSNPPTEVYAPSEFASTAPLSAA